MNGTINDFGCFDSFIFLSPNLAVKSGKFRFPWLNEIIVNETRINLLEPSAFKNFLAYLIKTGQL